VLKIMTILLSKLPQYSKDMKNGHAFVFDNSWNWNQVNIFLHIYIVDAIKGMKYDSMIATESCPCTFYFESIMKSYL